MDSAFSAPDWSAVRVEFPVLQDWTYFNAATLGPVPQRVVAATNAQMCRFDAEAGLDFLDWYTAADSTRAKLAQLVGSQPADIAFLPNAATGLSWLLNGLDWRPGDNLLTLAEEFPNNTYSALALRSTGVEIREFPVDDGFDTTAFLGQIDARTRVVLFSGASYSTGLQPPVAEIGKQLRGTRTIFAVDGTQHVGAQPVDVRASGIDFLFVHCYKWMLCPPGIGFASITPQLCEALPPQVHHWRSHKGWRNVTKLHHGEPELPAAAAKYEGGMLNFNGIAAVDEMVTWLLELGLENVYQRIEQITEATRTALRAHGGTLLGDIRSHYDGPILSARFANYDVDALAKAMRADKIALTARKGGLRVSPHFYNNEADAHRLGEAVGAHLGRLGA